MNTRTKAVLGLLLVTGCSMAYAASYNRVPSATFANASTVCGAIAGNQCYITDCLTTACTAGGGTEDALSQYNGSAWVVVASAAAGGAGAISGTTANTFGLDTDGDNLTLDPQAGGLTLDRATAGIVTLTASDDDAVADFSIVPGGGATLILGGSSTSEVRHITNPSNGFTFRNALTGSIPIYFQDFADTADDDMAHAAIVANCSDASSGSEDCDFLVGVAEGGAVVETRLNIAGSGGITLGSVNNNSFTVTTDGTGNAETVLPDDSIGAAELDDSACTSVVARSYNPTEAGATDDYVSLIAVDTGTGDASFSATETAEDQFIAPVALRAANLRVDTATAPGAGNDAWVITLREAAGSTALTCTIDEAATSCTDVANLEAIAAGAALDIQVTSSTGGGADPTASAEMRISFCLTAD